MDEIALIKSRLHEHREVLKEHLAKGLAVDMGNYSELVGRCKMLVAIEEEIEDIIKRHSDD